MKVIKKLLSYIPKKMGLPLIISFAVNIVAFYIPRLLPIYERYHYLNTEIDNYVSLVPWTVIIYFGCYIFWGVSYIMACYQPEDEAYRFLSAHFLAEMISLIIFIAFPTAINRPVLADKNFFDKIMALLYAADRPDNLFPSLHCLVSWFCCIGVRKNKKAPLWYKIFAHVFTLAICVSTLTTKQHVFVDTISGIALAELCYWLTNIIGFKKLYKRGISLIQSMNPFKR